MLYNVCVYIYGTVYIYTYIYTYTVYDKLKEAALDPQSVDNPLWKRLWSCRKTMMIDDTVYV